MDKDFSVVVPVKDEIDKLSSSLISLFKLNPDEIIICTDDPAPDNILKLVNILSRRFDMREKTRVIPVSRNNEYVYHQAWVRRYGFLKAKNDVILTSDADLIVTSSMLKGLPLVGKDNVGMVTFAKLRLWNSDRKLMSFVRLFTTTLMRWLHYSLFRHVRKGRYLSGFTGLYWLYRPYWKDTEGSSSSIKSLPVPLGKEGKTAEEIIFNIGEDVHLKNEMVRKHEVVYNARIGGKVMSDERPHETPRQIIRGRSNALNGQSLFSTLIHSLFFIEPLCFSTYLAERKKIHAERTNNPNP